MPGKFVVKKGSTGKFRFSLVSTNGQIVATSEAYNSKASAMNGIRSVMKMVGGAEVEDQTTKEWAAGEADRKAAPAAKKSKAAGNKKAAPAAKKSTAAGNKKATAAKKKTGASKT